VVHELNQYLQGWIGYFRVQEFRYLFRVHIPANVNTYSGSS
jgi:Group II intron, maturase-specific domain